MIAGLPGTGLGGVFYFLAALVLVAREGLRALRGETITRGKLLARMMVMLVGIVAALSITYWLLGQVMPQTVVSGEMTPVVGGAGPAAHGISLPALFVATLPVQLGVLAALLVGIELLRVLLKWRGGAQANAPGETVPVAETLRRRNER